MYYYIYFFYINDNVLLTENSEFDDQIKKCAEWLKDNIAPWGDVLEK